ncbi:hypothetical protein [Chitinophaga barathri]|uniref:Uncharacterized protein n=1 Tax=Chitinophaga barathri TaxID=1647451 RepID=A0A3N4MCS1_9BACT|nr:hypothetical protein [Chitinophaga barathri]RPD39327.1 hypothetical protein EG028_19565 [Chitinophaga barathri]
MKRKILGFTVLCTMAVFAFAFKAQPIAVVGTLFQLDDASQPFLPQSYSVATIDPLTACPNSSAVCVLDVPLGDIYTSGPNNGKPKVDIATGAAGELSDDIITALGNASDPTSFPSRSRVIYEKQP